MFALPNHQAQVTSAAFAQARLSFGSGLLTILPEFLDF
jgi:hypothetical protein